LPLDDPPRRRSRISTTREIVTAQRVHALLDAGASGATIARELGISKSTVSYHKRRLGHSIDTRCNRRYDWDAVQRFYDMGHSITECQERFGFARKTFMDAAARGAITTRAQGAPLTDYLVAGRRVNRTHLKGRLLAEGLKDNLCECCGIRDWQGAPLAMALHHVNGDGLDNRIENLVMLCPNCHAQTPNFSGRNRRLRRLNRRLEVLPTPPGAAGDSRAAA
jgi:DNA-binding CsgD family transcriptional regulator